MRKHIWKLLTAVLCVCLGMAVFAACGEKENPADTTYTVTYVGGEGATGTAPASETHKEGEKFALAKNTFSKADSTFDKWSDGTNTYAAEAEYTMPAKNVTFTAQWKANTPTPATTYTITFTLGEGVTGTAPTMSAKAEGAKFNLPDLPAGITKEGHTFSGWNDGTKTYAAGAEYTMPAKAVTFTAQWTPNTPATTYTITFSLGTGAMGTPPTMDAKEEGAKFNLPKLPADANKDGYTFKAWSDGTAEYAEDAEYTMPAHNVTFTAIWTAKPTYAITFSLGDGVTGTAPTMSAKAEGAKITLPAAPDDASKTGYTLTAWNDGTTDYPVGSQYTMPGHAVTFTAVWTMNPLTGKWTGTGTESSMELTLDVELSIIEAPASDPDHAIYVVYYLNADMGGYATPSYTFAKLAEPEDGQPYQISDTYSSTFEYSEGVLTVEVNGISITMAYSPLPQNITLPATFHYIDKGYGSLFGYTGTVDGDKVSIVKETYGEEKPDSKTAKAYAIGEYIYLEIPDDTSLFIRKEGQSYIGVDANVVKSRELIEGALQKYTVTWQYTPEDGDPQTLATLEVWGGCKISEMDRNIFDTAEEKLRNDNPSVLEYYTVQWSEIEDYIPTGDITITATVLEDAAYPDVTFSNGAASVGSDDPRVRALFTYENHTWSITLPSPETLGFTPDGDAWDTFAGWTYGTSSFGGDKTAQAGEKIENPADLTFTATWEDPLSGQWDGTQKKVFVEKGKYDSSLGEDFVARILIWTEGDSPAAKVGIIRYDSDSKAFTVEGISGITSLSVAGEVLTINAKEYTKAARAVVPSPEDGIYAADGQSVKLEYRDNTGSFYKVDGSAVPPVFDTLRFCMSAYYVLYESREAKYALVKIDDETLGVYDLTENEYRTYTMTHTMYTVTFHANGGTVEGQSDPQTVQVEAGEALYLSRAGVTDPTPAAGMPPFLHWAARSGDEGSYQYTYHASVIVNGDMDFYAMYGYEISFEPNPDGFATETSYDNQYAYSNTTPFNYQITVADPTPEEGFTFLGWALSQTESDPENLFKHGGSIQLSGSAKEITLYAIWEGEPVGPTIPTVTFYPDEASKNAGEPSITLAELFEQLDPQVLGLECGMEGWTFKFPDPKTAGVADLIGSHAGDTFVQWKYGKDGMGEVQTANAGETPIAVMDGMYVYAVWEAAAPQPQPPTATFVKGEATGSDPEVEFVPSGEKYTLTLPENTYTAPSGTYFRGWQIGDVCYFPNEEYEAEKEENVQITAIWASLTTVTTDYPIRQSFDAATPFIRLEDGQTIRLVVKATDSNPLFWHGIINDGLIPVNGKDYWLHFRVDGYVYAAGQDENSVADDNLKTLRQADSTYDGANVEHQNAYLALYADGAVVTHEIIVTLVGKELTYTYKVYGSDLQTPAFTTTWKLTTTTANNYLDLKFYSDDLSTGAFKAQSAKATFHNAMSANQNPTAENKIDLKTTNFNDQMWKSEIRRGEKVVFSGKFSTEAAQVFHGPTVALHNSNLLLGTMRTDKYVLGLTNDGSTQDNTYFVDGAGRKYNVESSGTWEKMTDVDFTITIDYTSATQIVVTIVLGGYTNTYTITADYELSDVYCVDLGAEAVTQFDITGITRTHA